MKKRKKWPFVLGAVVILVGGGIAYLGHQMDKMSEQMALPASVQVAAADIVSTVSGGGYIAIDQSMDIKLPADLVIDEYLVEVGDMVEEGDIIANIDPSSITSAIVSAQSELESINDKLKDTSDMTSYEIEEYNTRKDFLNAKIEILTAYYLNPVIVATQSGVISAVGGDTASSNSDLDLGEYADLLMKNDPEPDSTGDETTASTDETTQSTEPSESSEETTEATENTAAPSESTPAETTPAPTTAPVPAFTPITSLEGLTVATPVAGEAPQSSIAETDTYAGLITWMPAGSVFAPGTSYTAMITLMPKAGYGFDPNGLPQLLIQGATVIPMTSADGNFVALVSFAPTEGEAPVGGSGLSFELPDDFDLNQYIQGYTAGALPTSDYAALYDAATASQYSALAAAYSQAGNISLGSSGRPSSNTSENVVVTIASTDTAILAIQIDEMDILQIHEGQTASLSFVAIPNQEFTGEIIHVSNIADGSSGNTKYDVQILVQMEEGMRFGMSADATITVSEATGVPSIPMEALQQTGSQTFVFTSVAEDGTLTGEVPVVTGVSDGLTVEIVSGVNMGDTVYYEHNEENPLAAFM